MINQHISFYSSVSGNAIFSCSIFLQVADARNLLNAKDTKMFFIIGVLSRAAALIKDWKQLFVVDVLFSMVLFP